MIHEFLFWDQFPWLCVIWASQSAALAWSVHCANFKLRVECRKQLAEMMLPKLVFIISTLFEDVWKTCQSPSKWCCRKWLLVISSRWYSSAIPGNQQSFVKHLLAGLDLQVPLTSRWLLGKSGHQSQLVAEILQHHLGELVLGCTSPSATVGHLSLVPHLQKQYHFR